MNIPVPSRRQEGSAFVIALLVLVVLTVAGLALALITQTEMQVGANERLVTRTFYAAEAGISMSIARALATNDYAGHIYTLNDPVGDGLVTGLRNEIRTTPLAVWSELPCNLCQINNPGEYESKKLVRYVMGVNATAVRVAGDDTALAERRLGAMMDTQPVPAGTEKYDGDTGDTILGRAEM